MSKSTLAEVKPAIEFFVGELFFAVDAPNDIWIRVDNGCKCLHNSSPRQMNDFVPLTVDAPVHGLAKCKRFDSEAHIHKNQS